MKPHLVLPFEVQRFTSSRAYSAFSSLQRLHKLQTRFKVWHALVARSEARYSSCRPF